MGKKAASKRAKPQKAVFVVFGLAKNGRAKGARFSSGQTELALEAATSPMQVYEAVSTEMQELAKKLPSTRVSAKGRPSLPFISKKLYEELHAASGGLVRDGADNESNACD